MLRPATYSGNTAQPLATLDAALSKSSGGFLLGQSISLADVSGWCCCCFWHCLLKQWL